MKKESNDTMLSVIIPAYNEEKRLGTTLDDLARFFREKGLSYEILVVSDGSSDGTAELVRARTTDFPGLRLVEYNPNRGKGYAVRLGMLEARGAYRLFMDADNSVTIDTVEAFLNQARQDNIDVTIGSIAFSPSEVIEHNGWHRRIFGSISKLLVRAVATPGIYDTQRGFKLFTARAAEAIFQLQKIDRFGFDIEILVIARAHGFSIRELPVSWDNPAGSKVHLRAYWDSFIELWRIYRNILRREYAPIHHRRNARAKARQASLVVLFLGEFPALFSRLVREILTSDMQIKRLREQFGAK